MEGCVGDFGVSREPDPADTVVPDNSGGALEKLPPDQTIPVPKLGSYFGSAQDRRVLYTELFSGILNAKIMKGYDFRNVKKAPKELQNEHNTVYVPDPAKDILQMEELGRVADLAYAEVMKRAV